MTQYVICLCTCPDGPSAEALARALVNERLAACVNRISGIVSTYRWDEGVEEDDESLLIVKTTADNVDALRRRLRELHDYDVPELLVLPVADGLPEYLDWISASVSL